MHAHVQINTRAQDVTDKDKDLGTIATREPSAAIPAGAVSAAIDSTPGVTLLSGLRVLWNDGQNANEPMDDIVKTIEPTDDTVNATEPAILEDQASSNVPESPDAESSAATQSPADKDPETTQSPADKDSDQDPETTQSPAGEDKDSETSEAVLDNVDEALPDAASDAEECLDTIEKIPKHIVVIGAGRQLPSS